MDLSRLTLGRQIAGAGAIVLIISLFLPWYGVEALGFSVDGSGWEVMDFADILLFIGGAATLAIIGGEATGRLPVTLPVPSSQLLLSIAGTAVLLVLLRLIDLPGDEVDRKYGIFVALLSAGAMAYGAWRAQSE